MRSLLSLELEDYVIVVLVSGVWFYPHTIYNLLMVLQMFKRN